MSRSTFIRLAASMTAAIVLSAGAAHAVDTTEPFDRGAADFEMYLSQDGVGLASGDRSLGSEFVLGYGLTDRLSALVSTSMMADGFLLNGEGALAVGVFGNVLERGPWSLDLALALSAPAGGDGATAEPQFELNWDAAPRQDSWGLFARGGLAVSGHHGETGPQRLTETTLAAGAYWTVAADTQLLVEYAGAFAADEPGGSRRWHADGLALGCNRAVSDSVEMIGQICWCPPGEPVPASFGAMIGFVATLPAP